MKTRNPFVGCPEMILFLLCGVPNIGKKNIAELVLRKLNDKEESKGYFKRVPVHTTKNITGKNARENFLIYTPEDEFNEMKKEKLIEYGGNGIVQHGIALDDVKYAFKNACHGLVVTSVESALILRREFPEITHAVYCQTPEKQLPKSQTTWFDGVLTKAGDDHEMITDYLSELMLTKAGVRSYGLTG